MELNIRRLQEEDWETLCSWWDWWPGWVAPQRDILPENGKSGLMVEKNGVPIVAGFLYFTNGNVALLEWIISNPHYKNKDRKQALELLIVGSEEVCKKQGIGYMFTTTRSKTLIDMHSKLGWAVDKKPSYEIIKKIN